MSVRTAVDDGMYIDARGCANRYKFSENHWRRLVDAGKAPGATRFGRLLRWRVADLEAWERDGCKPPRNGKVRAK